MSKAKGSQSVISRSSSRSSLSAQASAAVGKVKTAARKVTRAVKSAVNNVRPKRKKVRTERAQDAIENGDDEVQFLATSPAASRTLIYFVFHLLSNALQRQIIILKKVCGIGLTPSVFDSLYRRRIRLSGGLRLSGRYCISCKLS
jgi:hypothetical protein